MTDLPRRTPSVSPFGRLKAAVKTAVARVGAVALLLVTDLSLRLVGYRQTCRWMLALSPTPSPTPYPGSAVRAFAIASTIEEAVRVTKVNCLRRSLVVWWVLRWLGIASRVRMGINLTDGHAWVEFQDVVLTDVQDIAAKYAILYDDAMLPENVTKRLNFE